MFPIWRSAWIHQTWSFSIQTNKKSWDFMEQLIQKQTMLHWHHSLSLLPIGSNYQIGCESDSTEESCELKIEGEEIYCPNNPDNVACVEFLHNAISKDKAQTGICAGKGDPRTWVICPQEADPERYCLNTNDPVFCKTVGNICDVGGFVRPEYPYCKWLEREYSIPQMIQINLLWKKWQKKLKKYVKG